jgi:uncharacterized protein YjbJ (UPF0337 family)
MVAESIFGKRSPNVLEHLLDLPCVSLARVIAHAKKLVHTMLGASVAVASTDCASAGNEETELLDPHEQNRNFQSRPLGLAIQLLSCWWLKRSVPMKDSTKDKAQGTAHELKGAVKEKVGHATNNPNLEEEGKDEKIGGKIQKKVGDVEKVLEK